MTSIYNNKENKESDIGDMLRTKDVPCAVRIVTNITNKCCPCHQSTRLLWNQGAVFALTYMAYMCYHLTRKPISVVKNVLSVNCSNVPPPPNFPVNSSNRDTWCDWAPFGKNIIYFLYLGWLGRENF